MGKLFYPTLISLISIEMLLFAWPAVNHREAIQKSDIQLKQYHFDDSMEAVRRIKELDQGPFYRIDKVYGSIKTGYNDGMVQDFFGSRVVNPSADLDEDTLKAIAEQTGGRYFRARDVQSLERIYAILDELEPVESDVEIIRPIDELFYWPLGLAYLLALLAALFSMRPFNLRLLTT